MVLIEDALDLEDVVTVARGLVPRQRDHPVEVVAHHGGLGRHEAHLGQPDRARAAPWPWFRAGMRARLIAVVSSSSLVGELVLMTELLADRLELLVEIELLLILVHLRADLTLDLALDLEDLELRRHGLRQQLELIGHARRLEERLFLRDLDQQVRGHGVSQRRRVGDVVGGEQHFVGDAPVEVHVVVEHAHDVAHERLGLGPDAALGRGQVDAHRVMVGGPEEALDPHPAQALDQHAQRAVGQPEELEDPHHRAHAIELLVRGVGDLAALLRGDEEHAVARDRLLDGVDRRQSPDQERDRHVREDHHVPQRQQRQAVAELELLVAARHQQATRRRRSGHRPRRSWNSGFLRLGLGHSISLGARPVGTPRLPCGVSPARRGRSEAAERRPGCTPGKWCTRSRRPGRECRTSRRASRLRSPRGVRGRRCRA